MPRCLEVFVPHPSAQKAEGWGTLLLGDAEIRWASLGIRHARACAGLSFATAKLTRVPLTFSFPTLPHRTRKGGAPFCLAGLRLGWPDFLPFHPHQRRVFTACAGESPVASTDRSADGRVARHHTGYTSCRPSPQWHRHTDLTVRATRVLVALEELVHLGCALTCAGEAGQAQALQQ